MSDKQLRYKLYEKQRQLLRLQVGYEYVCLPGELVRINPRLFWQPKQRTT